MFGTNLIRKVDESDECFVVPRDLTLTYLTWSTLLLGFTLASMPMEITWA